MSAELTAIHVDAATAGKLAAQAAARGLGLSELLAELVEIEAAAASTGASAIAELDQRRARAKAGKTHADSDVTAWLDTWGTADFRPWAMR